MKCFKYTTVQKFGVCTFLLFFLKEVSYAHQDCIYLIKKYGQNCIVVKYYSVSHDTSEIIIICQFGAQAPFLIINVEKSCAAVFFVEFIRNIQNFRIQQKTQKNSISLK